MKLTIEKLYDTEKVCFYTLRIEEDGVNETQKFFNEFSKQDAYREELSIPRRWMQNVGSRWGAIRERFRFEENASAMPGETCKLRLYCIVCTKETVIIGGGAHKTAQTAQECPNVRPHFNFINKVAKAFDAKVLAKEITYNGKYLEGDLTLEIT